MVSQDVLKAQLKELMSIEENMHCLDCGDKRPMWASLIVPPPGAATSQPLGCFCCYHCSGAHRSMGTHICFVRSTNLDEWKEREIEAMRKGGNELINKLFEAKLTGQQKVVVKPDRHTDLDPRSNFIYDKYQHRNWYDSEIAQRKSTFERPQRPSGVEFDDFFALRTKGVFDDDWHDSKDGSNESSFDPIGDILSPSSSKGIDRASVLDSLQRMNSKRQIMNSIERLDMDRDNPKPSVKKIAQGMRDMNNSFSTGSVSQIKENDVYGSLKAPKSARGGLSYTRTPSRGDGRANLMSTLKRMDSKREMLDSIRGLDVDQDDQILSPRRVAQTNRRKRNKAQQTEELNQRRGSGDGDAKGRLSRPGPLRNSSHAEENLSRSSRMSPSDRSSSRGSIDSTEKTRSRRIRRNGSDDSASFKNHVEVADRRKQDPTNGVSRAQSMSDEIANSKAKHRSRSKSVKRGVQRSISSDGYSIDDSQFSTGDAEASLASGRSSTRKPPRRPKSSTLEEDKPSSARVLNESQSSRRSRDDDRRRRSPRRTAAEGQRSRTSSPASASASTGTSRSNSRRRQKSVSRKGEGNLIGVSRVPTVRDANERNPRSGKPSFGKSPRSRKRLVDPNIEAELGHLLISGRE